MTPTPEDCRSGQSFAWVSVDEADNDPKVLLAYVAEALDAMEPLDEREGRTARRPRCLRVHCPGAVPSASASASIFASRV